jgi:YidC/Oxa1 family membrane protein insertase
MEKRVILAIALSFLILILYQLLFFKKKPLPEAPPVQTIEKTPEIKPSEKKPVPPQAVSKRAEQKPQEVISAPSEEQILIDTSLYKAIWSNKGAVLKSWKLKKHKDDQGENLELVSESSAELHLYPFSLRTDDPSIDKIINTGLYKFSASEFKLKEGQKGELRFQFADENGIQVEKVFIFQEGKYDFDVQISVRKKGEEIEPRLIWGPGFSNLSPTELKQRTFGSGIGIVVLSSGKLFQQKEKKFKPEENLYNFVQWAAYENNYFAALFLTFPQKATAAFLKEGPEKNPYFLLSLSYPQKAYIGPKEFDTLVELGYSAKRLIRFGAFGFIAEILLKASKLLHNLVPNWGFTIIILTIVIKILFFPLSYSGMRSMTKMQELQPKLKSIRAKYKKAKQDIALRRKMNEEIMALYKEHGINPAGGCLPFLIQIPVFWGFFRLLVVSIEYRHSPFILWIKDLSVHDPYYITPILMGITQFISQKMTPTTAEPSQQKMMLIIPVVFTFAFMNFQSGLILYWLTTNVLQIGQQYIMNRLAKKKKRESHGKRGKK